MLLAQSQPAPAALFKFSLHRLQVMLLARIVRKGPAVRALGGQGASRLVRTPERGCRACSAEPAAEVAGLAMASEVVAGGFLPFVGWVFLATFCSGCHGVRWSRSVLSTHTGIYHGSTQMISPNQAEMR